MPFPRSSASLDAENPPDGVESVPAQPNIGIQNPAIDGYTKLTTESQKNYPFDTQNSFVGITSAGEGTSASINFPPEHDSKSKSHNEWGHSTRRNATTSKLVDTQYQTEHNNVGSGSSILEERSDIRNADSRDPAAGSGLPFAAMPGREEHEPVSGQTEVIEPRKRKNALSRLFSRKAPSTHAKFSNFCKKFKSKQNVAQASGELPQNGSALAQNSALNNIRDDPNFLPGPTFGVSGMFTLNTDDPGDGNISAQEIILAPSLITRCRLAVKVKLRSRGSWSQKSRRSAPVSSSEESCPTQGLNTLGAEIEISTTVSTFSVGSSRSSIEEEDGDGNSSNDLAQPNIPSFESTTSISFDCSLEFTGETVLELLAACKSGKVGSSQASEILGVLKCISQEMVNLAETASFLQIRSAKEFGIRMPKQIPTLFELTVDVDNLKGECWNVLNTFGPFVKVLQNSQIRDASIDGCGDDLYGNGELRESSMKRNSLSQSVNNAQHSNSIIFAKSAREQNIDMQRNASGASLRGLSLVSMFEHFHKRLFSAYGTDNTSFQMHASIVLDSMNTVFNEVIFGPQIRWLKLSQPQPQLSLLNTCHEPQVKPALQSKPHSFVSLRESLHNQNSRVPSQSPFRSTINSEKPEPRAHPLSNINGQRSRASCDSPVRNRPVVRKGDITFPRLGNISSMIASSRNFELSLENVNWQNPRPSPGLVTHLGDHKSLWSRIFKDSITREISTLVDENMNGSVLEIISKVFEVNRDTNGRGYSPDVIANWKTENMDSKKKSRPKVSFADYEKPLRSDSVKISVQHFYSWQEAIFVNRFSSRQVLPARSALKRSGSTVACSRDRLRPMGFNQKKSPEEVRDVHMEVHSRIDRCRLFKDANETRDSGSRNILVEFRECIEYARENLAVIATVQVLSYMDWFNAIRKALGTVVGCINACENRYTHLLGVISVSQVTEHTLRSIEQTTMDIQTSLGECTISLDEILACFSQTEKDFEDFVPTMCLWNKFSLETFDVLTRRYDEFCTNQCFLESERSQANQLSGIGEYTNVMGFLLRYRHSDLEIMFKYTLMDYQSLHKHLMEAKKKIGDLTGQIQSKLEPLRRDTSPETRTSS